MAIHHVNDGEIDKLGGTFHTLKGKFDTGTTGMKDIEIKAGDFDKADELEQLVITRGEEANTCATNVSNACGDIGDGLKACATLYYKEEDDNNVGANSLDTMIKDVDDDLPGVKGHH
jgi:hypothetical protein